MSAPPPAVTAPRPEPRPFFPLGRPEPRRHHRAGLSASLRSRSSSIRNAVFLSSLRLRGLFPTMSDRWAPCSNAASPVPFAACSFPQFSVGIRFFLPRGEKPPLSSRLKTLRSSFVRSFLGFLDLECIFSTAVPPPFSSFSFIDVFALFFSSLHYWVCSFPRPSFSISFLSN